MHISVVVTHYHDPRVERLLASLWEQERTPDRIIVADGGSPPEFRQNIMDYISVHDHTELHIYPGRCIDTRRQLIDNLNGTDVICFIDSDMAAPPRWVGSITAPICGGGVDFTGGPILRYREPRSELEHIVNLLTPSSPLDMSYIPMGNSAWSRRVFDTIGTFDDSDVSSNPDDDRVYGSYHVSDDYDINIRALQAGFHGTFVEDAPVFHDQSHIDTYGKLIKYQYGNYVRTAMAYLKHGVPPSKFTNATRRRGIRHPFELVIQLLKPVALIHGWQQWNMIQKKRGENNGV